METLGSQIRHYRKLRGLTQKDFAEQCGITDKSQVSRYEKNVKAPSVSTLQRICEVLKVQLTLAEKIIA